jgi:hypothetical protein
VTIKEALESGRLPNVDAVLWVRESIIASGSAAGTRAIDVAAWDGIACRIYPDRGLDVGQAWYGGIPLAWVSRVGESPPLSTLEGMAWGDAFGGGLVTTCGLRNVGMPSEGHGLHGTYSHLPARDVAVTRNVENNGASISVTGTVRDEGPPAFIVRRTIRICAGVGMIQIEDHTVNSGATPEAAPLLYHFNFGYPLWAPPAHLEIPVERTVARDAASEVALGFWHQPPEIAVGPERVLEHDLGDAGEGFARIVNQQVGLSMTLRWNRAALPRLNQWLDPNPGMGVLGVEPANCSTRGRAADRQSGTLPALGPGETRTTRVSLEISPVV